MPRFYTRIECPECGAKGKFIIENAFTYVDDITNYDVYLDDEKYGQSNPMYGIRNDEIDIEDRLTINRNAKVHCSACGHDCTDSFDMNNKHSYDRIFPHEW